MLNIFSVIGAAAGAYFLYLSGPDEPAWLPWAVVMLAFYCIAVVGLGFQHTITEEDARIVAEQDEHRDQSI